jgi:GDPmannose 4,6-dehydratase
LKKTLITGITGQDEANLAELLIEKSYKVLCFKWLTSLFNTDRTEHLYQNLHETSRKFILLHGDPTNSTSLMRIIQPLQLDEIYKLAALPQGRFFIRHT